MGHTLLTPGLGGPDENPLVVECVAGDEAGETKRIMMANAAGLEKPLLPSSSFVVWPPVCARG